MLLPRDSFRRASLRRVSLMLCGGLVLTLTALGAQPVQATWPAADLFAAGDAGITLDTGPNLERFDASSRVTLSYNGAIDPRTFASPKPGNDLVGLTPVPEPDTLLLMVSGLIALTWVGRRI
jgi:hypothetical protein